jgi:hypothetical protein
MDLRKCVVCLEIPKKKYDIGFECETCVDGIICGNCYYGVIINKIDFENNEVLFKRFSCYVCRAEHKEEYVVN